MSAAFTIPPDGWRCTRAPGHDGPCAAHPTLTIDTESDPGSWADAIANTPHLAAQCNPRPTGIVYFQRNEAWGVWEQVVDSAAGREGVFAFAPVAPRPVAPQQGGMENTDRWWAQRWIEKATPGELAAMRELLGA